jgi:hypothetical protein
MAMNIENCPECGGTHFGSNECPIKHPPKSRGLDHVLLTIQLERRRLQTDFDREMAALDRRERLFLGLKTDDK